MTEPRPRKVVFGVIDRIEENNRGNLYDEPLIRKKNDPSKLYLMSSITDDITDSDYEPLGKPHGIVFVRVPNFTLGEIIPMSGEYGRDIWGNRKPSKWDVGIKHFDDINEAIEYSLEVRKNAE